ncbi:hypothetical protein [Sphingomonas alba]|uniref:Anti-sigma factor NepR domain-containing protein n=1 Tax=Sphingomonas alba TaxID=2908208 RepID=A0ABT0RM28_9SPHN|nr:hypothetical protein [Sphingomonas alba]MCL6683527.1 hypothetical protein [Sphingomonas alba]
MTQSDLDILGQEFRRYFPVNDDPCFIDLVAAIDEADKALAAEEREEQ